MNSIADILNNFIDNRLNKERVYSAVGTVESVDGSKKVCSVRLLTDEVVEDVRLETDLSIDSTGAVIKKGPSGFLLVPASGSLVTVTFLNSSDAFVSIFSEIAEIYLIADLTSFNGGEKGGLININDLVGKLNGLVNSLSGELIKIQSGITGAGGAYTPGTLEQFDKDDFEDTKIIH